MEPSKKKYVKFAKFYTLATQGILTMVVLLLIGFFIGYKIDKDSFWPPLLACIGVLCGLVIFVSYVLYLIQEESKK